jgi:predicted Zn-ribbon and HTH transcriptional regulator
MAFTSEYEGTGWKIYYCRIEDFEKDLQDFLAFLDSLDSDEEVVAIIPNTGAVKARSIVLTGGTEVKGIAVVVRKLEEGSHEDIGETSNRAVMQREIPKSYFMKCNKCGKEFTRDFSECPYCGSQSYMPVA